MIPPKWNELTPELQSKFRINDTIPKEHWYIDDSKTYNKKKYDVDEINKLIYKAKSKNTYYYGKTDTWLYKALDTISINNKKVAVVGSLCPWYEAIVIAYGGIPVTIDYNIPDYNHPNISLISLVQIQKEKMLFDYIVSISSIEHDGLGRYGDPIDPDGDIRAMNEMRNFLNPNGLLFLAVPIGIDMIVWNAHRIYGNKRFPELIKDWEVVSKFGYDETIINTSSENSLSPDQPVIVLK